MRKGKEKGALLASMMMPRRPPAAPSTVTARPSRRQIQEAQKFQSLGSGFFRISQIRGGIL